MLNFGLLALLPAFLFLEQAAVAGEAEAASPEAAAKAEKIRVVVAMEARKGDPVYSGEIFTNGAEPVTLVSRSNLRVELSPHSVADFDEKGGFRLLRGSAEITSRPEVSVSTASAKVDFIGRIMLSYDHKEHSTSAFVLEGEGRMVNPEQPTNTTRLARFRGATLVAGEVLPQLLRQLDVGSVDSWLAGYAWPEARRREMLKDVPGEAPAEQASLPKHLVAAKLEDYFSSIDTADEFHQPNYYEKKFADPDQVMAEEKANKNTKSLTPEEAALISLPNTKIDLGFELPPQFVTAKQKEKELETVEPVRGPVRKLASVEPPKKKVVKKAPEEKKSESGDADVDGVLARLRALDGRNTGIARVPASGRGPASVGATPVLEPAIDYSQNF
jgi:hypothetical protein